MLLPRPPERGAVTAAGATSRRSRCSASTSTTSRRSTTRWATAPATAAEAGRRARCGPACAQSDTVARLGGDEFAIVQVGRRPAGGRASALCDRIVRVPEASRSASTATSSTSASASALRSPRSDGDDPERLLKNADIALYRAKQAGRGTYRFFEPRWTRSCRPARRWSSDLRQALAEGRARAALPAAGRPRGPERQRRRGAAALAPSGARPDAARRVHPDRRGDRPDHRRSASGCCARPARRRSPGRASAIAVNLSPVQFRQRRAGRDRAATS